MATTHRFERSAPTVLTPHEGELGRLLGEESGWIAAHRLEAAKRGAEKYRCVCLLKGADTLIAEPGSGIWVCSLGTPALATNFHPCRWSTATDHPAFPPCTSSRSGFCRAS